VKAKEKRSASYSEKPMEKMMQTAIKTDFRMRLGLTMAIQRNLAKAMAKH
jgi:hypothetical protein